jgi:two-component system, NtrC family, sensor kinase
MSWDMIITRLFPERLTRDKYYRSLIRNMVLAIIIVSMVPMSLVSSTLYLQFRKSYHAKVSDHLRELVQKHKQNIDNYLQERLTDIRLMTARYGYERLKEEDLLQQNLDLLKEEYEKAFVDLGLVDGQGHQTAYAGPFKLADAYYGDAEWFKDVSQKDYVISDVFLGLRGLPHFIVAVRSEADGRKWILRATIDFVAFTALVQNIRIGETGFAYILNRKGKFQTTPFEQPFPTAVIDSGASQELWKQMFSNSGDVQVFLRKDKTGEEYVYAEAPLKNGEWLLVYQQRASDAFADLNRSFAITTLIMALGAAAIIFMALALSRRMVTRIAEADEEKHLMDEKVIETGKLASIGELASGVAHEINNPVAIMVEEAGWLDRRPPGGGGVPRKQEYRGIASCPCPDQNPGKALQGDHPQTAEFRPQDVSCGPGHPGQRNDRGDPGDIRSAGEIRHGGDNDPASGRSAVCAGVALRAATGALELDQQRT